MDQHSFSSSACSACGDNLGLEPAKRPLTATARAVIAIDRLIYRISKRWLFFVNSVFFVHVATLFLAPALVAAGHAGIARPIYAFNGLFCHQLEGRTFHVFGEKMACCQRCAAIYGSLLIAALLFAAIRGRIRTPRLPELGALALPVIVDGGGQALGFWTSTPASRVITGTCLGIAICWALLPYLETGFGRIRAQLEALFSRLATEGRARPL